MREAVRDLADVIRQPYSAVANVKANTGRRAIGCFPMYVPHELVHAAGMLPVDIYGDTGELRAASDFLQPITCYPVRSIVESLLSGRLSGLDGMIYSTICTGAASGGDMCRSFGLLPFCHQLVVPRSEHGTGTFQYFQYQIERLRTSLETFGGRPITDQALAASIKLYNRSRDLLEELARICRHNLEALPPQDLAVVRAAGSFIAREDYVDRLAHLVSMLTDQPAPTTTSVGVVLAGGLCDLPQFDILSVIHEAGGAIVEDDTVLGQRATVRVAECGDPITALAQHYMDMPPCPTKFDESVDAHFDYLLGLVNGSSAQGVIFLRPMYCDEAGLEYPLLANRLGTSNIPALCLDINGREASSGQVRTRLQAFVEMLGR